ncbi:MAG: hypothetical protein EXQ74_00480 [Thermoleophilia bacterium]|nr:hypothetical protein [Thermoleophilia bacterium]
MDDDLDLGDAAAFILGERPGLDEHTVWMVLNEIRNPPVRSADGMATDLITRLHPQVRAKDVKAVLADWREYARLAVEEDWD